MHYLYTGLDYNVYNLMEYPKNVHINIYTQNQLQVFMF